MKRKFISSIIVGATAISSCSLDPTPSPTKLPVIYSAVVAPPVISREEPLAETIEPKKLTLPQALALTLEKNPELKSFSYTLRAGEARIIQAGLRPNPEISLTVEDVLGTGKYNGGSQAQSTLQLSQIIELGDKRSARVGVANALRDQFKDDYEIKRVEVLTDLTSKFIRTAADEELSKLAEKGEQLAKQALQTIQKRSQAGGTSELEEAKARVLLARAHIAAEHAEHELITSKRELSSFWGASNPTFSELVTDLFQNVSLPSFEETASRIDQSLEIKRWVTEKRLREAEQKLAEAKSVPNIVLGGGPRRLEASNEESFVFQFSVPLTIFDRNQGARQEASVLKDKVDVDAGASHLRLLTTLFGLYQETKHSLTALERMKSEIIPQAERSLKIAQTGYDRGRFSYLELIDAQRTLLEVHRENIEAAYSLHSYVNSIERLLGSPLSNKESKIN